MATPSTATLCHLVLRRHIAVRITTVRRAHTALSVARFTRPLHQSLWFSSSSAALPPSPDARWNWLKDPNNPQLKQFLKSEQAYLSDQLRNPKFRQIERAFYEEFRHRVVREDVSIPECIGSYEYYMRQDPGENYNAYYRKHRVTGVEEVVLNQNVETVLSQEFQFVTTMKISPNEQFLLLVMENEHEQCRAFLKQIKTGKVHMLHDVLNLRNVEWAASSRAFYFTKIDRNGRPYTVYRYDCTTQNQELIYEEQDEAFFVDVSQTKDGKYVLVNCNSKNTSEIYALNSHNPTAKPQLLRQREPETAYFADHANDQFFIVTNADRAENYKIVCSRAPSSEPWKTLVPDARDVKIEDVDLFQKYLVLYERVQSVPRIRVIDLADASKEPHYIPLPEQHQIGRIAPGVNKDYESHRVRFSITTPLVPEIVYDYDMASRQLYLLKETTLDDDRKQKQQQKRHKASESNHWRKSYATEPTFRPDIFTCERVHVPSMTNLDVQIPLTLIHRRDLQLNSNNPTLLLGYGAYGTNLEADFELEHISLLERGWVIALAHPRGGGELGLQWYHNGKGLHKRNTFDDYLSCAHHLLDRHYTSPLRLAGKGVSAGGLIMGYMANEHPSLFQALIMKVPFVDILQTMLDPNLPLTIHEYDEWGNPCDPKVFTYIKSFAPCENMRKNQRYPSMFITGSMNDQRVQFWEPVKWIYKLRHLWHLNGDKVDDETPLWLLKMGQDDGHFGGGGRLEQLQESAMEIAFLYRAMHLPFP